MKQYLFTLLCLLTLGLRAAPIEPTEPVGQRFGMSLLEVLDSLHKEGIYQYLSSSGNPATPNVMFRDDTGQRVLQYSFTEGRCSMALLSLPLTELDSVVRLYDSQFPNTGTQMWRSPYGRIRVVVAIGEKSLRSCTLPRIESQ
ncbi:MAG: hypothetical protein EOO60_02070 [Hymenobacter sp.]|nr:MAG: hypothetical protein EOO60_02070 [Hymenobacter sp.]